MKACDLQPDSREGQAGPITEVAERFVVAWKPGNAGGAKGPQFKDNAGRGEGPGHWRKPNIPQGSGATGGVARDREEPLLASGSCALACFLVREPDAGNSHVRFDEREVETEHGWASEAPANERAGNR